MSALILHGYWRSGTSYRTRIALGLKGLSYQQKALDLRRGEQHSPDYLKLNPQGLVPTLETEDGILMQSVAILEWLEEKYPDPPLLPRVAADRAVVRAMCGIIACDIHPINNLRILKALRHDLGASQDQVNTWIARWISEGFTALEAMVARYGKGFAFGDAPTLADCHLVPQVYSAERFNVDLSPFPTIRAAVEKARILQAFEQADPKYQPDAY
ncbi:maleylacetoacetate isomerase [Rhizorhapis sp. SPR117]|uniref:maleylacetoacetate isomerase n=1 Tax=Rhizorhapis sp. SPR117 TaxID=2912611 RepID=UPI001F000C53|nr:maleylacetoacetate isomerase [Rhizorhapis sp. SPR117]